MKKTILTLSLIFISSLIFAQKKDYKTFYKSHKNEDSVVSFSAPIGLARLFIDDDDEVNAIIKKGKKVRILVFENDTNAVFSDFKNNLSSDLYERFMYIKDKGTKVELYVREDEDLISEIIMFVRGEDELVTMGIYGNFTYDDLSEMTKQ